MKEVDGRLWEAATYRPKRVQRRKGIQVSKRGQEIALEAAHIHYESNRRRRFQHTFGLDDADALRTDHVGSLAKVAIFEFLGLDPSPVLIDRDLDQYKNPDIEPNVWIRGAEGLQKRLYLRKDDEPNADGLFAWAPVGSLEGGFVVFAGWVYARNGMKPHFWQQVRNDRPPQFYVPNGLLEPYSTFVDAMSQQGSLF